MDTCMGNRSLTHRADNSSNDLYRSLKQFSGLLEVLENIPPDITVGEITNLLKGGMVNESLTWRETFEEIPSEGVSLHGEFFTEEPPLGDASMRSIAKSTLDALKEDETLEGFFKSLTAIGHLWYWEQVDILENLLRSGKDKFLHDISFTIDDSEEFLRVEKNDGAILLEIYSAEDVQDAISRLGREFFQPTRKKILDKASQPVVILSTRYGRVDPNHERSKLKDPGDISEYDRTSKIQKFLLGHRLREVYERTKDHPGYTYRCEGNSIFLTYKGADLVSFSLASCGWMHGKQSKVSRVRLKQLSRTVEHARKTDAFKGGLGNPPRKPFIQASYYEILRFIDDEPVT